MELTLDRLSKQYSEKIAVDRVSITLSHGVYGLLGANGAGKTTLMRLICGILHPTSGEVLYNGTNINTLGENYRDILGYMPQEYGYYPEFSAKRFLLYMASLKGLSKTEAITKTKYLLEETGLSDVANKKIKTFSGGMKRRLGIAQALLNDPEVLVLDEPTAGLDPKERVRFRNLISSLAKDKLVLLSTHIVSDIEYIAGYILVMKDGQLIHQGKPETIVSQIDGCVWTYETPDQRISDELSMKFNISNLKTTTNGTELRIISKTCPHEGAVSVSPTLEDLYLYYFNDKEEHNV